MSPTPSRTPVRTPSVPMSLYEGEVTPTVRAVRMVQTPTVPNEVRSVGVLEGSPMVSGPWYSGSIACQFGDHPRSNKVQNPVHHQRDPILSPERKRVSPHDDLSDHTVSYELRLGHPSQSWGISFYQRDKEVKTKEIDIGSPAMRHGITPGGTLTEINGIKVRSIDDVIVAKRDLSQYSSLNIKLTIRYPSKVLQADESVKTDVNKASGTFGIRMASLALPCGVSGLPSVSTPVRQVASPNPPPPLTLNKYRHGPEQKLLKMTRIVDGLPPPPVMAQHQPQQNDRKTSILPSNQSESPSQPVLADDLPPPPISLLQPPTPLDDNYPPMGAEAVPDVLRIEGSPGEAEIAI